jgi:DNA-binding NtrC family response regulator
MKKRILLVDDELTLLDIIAQRIESWGYEVIQVSSGKDCLEVLEKKKADIVILDYVMPEMDGVDTLKKIREINVNIPVIMFTGHPDTQSVKDTERLGISHYIPKFCDHYDVQTLLKDALNIVGQKLEKNS